LRSSETNTLQRISSVEEFGVFFRQNYHSACLVALRYVKDFRLAEDLVQDVFVAFWEKKDSLLITGNLKNYLFVAVRNYAINKVQRNKENTVSLAQVLVEISDSELPGNFNDEELAAKISKAIGELPENCRRIFNLAYQHNLTYQQIADALNISKNTVKTQMGIAYKQLRSKLSGVLIALSCIFLKK
jgi:RNA polymerase sigma-70 factor (ECF subfamily)